jgi:prevent-host-death family protein
MSTVVPVHQARKHLGEIVERAFYEEKPFILTRVKKPMAVLVGTRVFAQILELVEKYDSGLADTLAIMANPEIQAILKAGEQNIREGKSVPFNEWLNED